MTMLEKMAREIAMCFVNSDKVDQEWPRFGPVARAALLAIREPDEAMEQAADSLEPRPDWWPDEPGERNTPAQHFTAMIDAILNQKPEAGA